MFFQNEIAWNRWLLASESVLPGDLISSESFMQSLVVSQCANICRGWLDTLRKLTSSSCSSSISHPYREDYISIAISEA